MKKPQIMTPEQYRELLKISLEILEFGKKQNYPINNFENAIVQTAAIFLSFFNEKDRKEALACFKKDVESHAKTRKDFEQQGAGS